MAAPTTAIAGALSAVSLAVLIPAAFAQAPAQPDQTAAPAPAPPARPDGGPAPSLDEMEADIFGGKNAPVAPAMTAPARAPQAPPPPPRARPRVAPAPEEEQPAAPEGPSFVIELQTASFASGPLGGGLAPANFASSTLGGGVFVGARLPGDLNRLMIGGSVNFVSASITTTMLTAQGMTSSTTSASAFVVGGGARYSLLRASDGHVNLFGAGDLGFVRTSAAAGTTSASAPGVTLGVGPGLRLWIYDHLAVGYVARLRLVKQSGSNNTGDTTVAGLEGAFQIVGVF